MANAAVWGISASIRARMGAQVRLRTLGLYCLLIADVYRHF
ncbi:MAG: hypothetical protein WBK51_09570 [Polaromonas sp.]